jgi:DNA-binding NarL/FixJ family response regulator
MIRAMTTARILLIDDHAMFRSGMRLVLDAGIPGSEIIEASSLNDAIKAAPDKLDVTLLDIKMPGLNGMEGITLLKRKWPMTPVIVLSSEDGAETVRLALARGAIGFVSKKDTAANIVAAVNMVLRGEFVALAYQAERGGFVSGSPGHLTPRQCEVLDLLCRGLPNKLIARELSLSENTVRGHVQAILEFFQVTSRSEAIYAAHQRGLVA